MNSWSKFVDGCLRVRFSFLLRGRVGHGAWCPPFVVSVPDLTGFIRATVNRVTCRDGDSGMRASRGNLSGLNG